MTIQVFKPFYRKEEILKEIGECLDCGWTGMGYKTDRFESEFKKSTGFQYCHALNSATAALDLAVKQLKKKYDWGEDAEIITTPITFVSTNHAILYNNLKPIFADVDDSGCLDPKDVLDKITPKTKAIMFVALGGNPAQFTKILEIAKEHKLKVILDAAHAMGTRDLKGNHLGTEEGVDVVCFSFQTVKNLPTCDLGAICWKDPEMDAQSRRLSWLGISKSTFDRSNSSGSYKWYYDVPEVGYKYHSNSIIASMGLVGLKYLEQDNSYRRYLCDIYTSELKGIVEIVPHSKDYTSSRHLFQILVDKRDEVMLALGQSEIYCGVHYRDNTIYTMYKQTEYNLPNAQKFSDRTISLPLHLHLTPQDIKFICDKIKEILC